MGTSVLSRVRAANVPRAQITRGLIASSCLIRNRFTGSYFLRPGIAVTGRTAFEDIAYIDVSPLQSHGLDNPGQKLSGASDKWSPLDIFISARRLANKDDLGLRIPLAKDDVGSDPSEGTSLTITEFFFHISKSQCFPGDGFGSAPADLSPVDLSPAAASRFHTQVRRRFPRIDIRLDLRFQ